MAPVRKQVIKMTAIIFQICIGKVSGIMLDTLSDTVHGFLLVDVTRTPGSFKILIHFLFMINSQLIRCYIGSSVEIASLNNQRINPENFN
jgi:hypothetical protein